MKPEITIDEKHVYRLAGRIIPGVTSIIKACGLIDLQWATKRDMDRGTAVHRAVHLYELDDLDERSLDPVVPPYLAAWKAFKAETGYVSATYEQMIYHPTYQYAGTLDQTGTLNGRTCLIDLKTGACQPWWKWQGAAYNAIAKMQDRYSLELHDDGKWKLIPHTDKRDFQRFLACLTVAGMKE